VETVNSPTSPRKLIDALGGTQTLATRLGLPARTVQMWKFRRRIPRQRWPEIIQQFPQVTLDELREAEAQGE
jgi:DNA-binding transcriptional regulator YdaS (Cro superfamily)